MHGLSASGKSWVSRALVPALGLPRVRSDVERKRLAGLPAAADAAAAPEEGLYADRNTRTTYERLSECAEHALDGGYGAIIDAACLARWQRAVFRSVAERTRARLLIVSCHAERATLAERIARRRVERHDPSDATLEILDHQIAAEEPLTADELAVALRIDTDSTSPETAAARVKARLEDAGSCR
jgi:hypothetical protein